MVEPEIDRKSIKDEAIWKPLCKIQDGNPE
jgi:hypothetical protein